MTFILADRKVYVEFNNNGSVHALYSDGVKDPRVEDISPTEIGYSRLIAAIKAYFQE